MKQLIIAEKPSLAQKIVGAIGGMKRNGDYYENDKFVVISVFGHLLTLWDLNEYLHKENNKWELSDLNYFPEKFKFKVKDDKGIRDRYKLIKKLIGDNSISSIVNAGDSDREGEVLINIVIYSIFGQLRIKKPITRIWLEDQTAQTIKYELNHQRNIDDTKNLYNEGLARTYVDWIYGIYLTRYISIKSGTTLNAGRVIIPTVKFLYDRYKEIKDFVPEKYLKINCEIIKDGTKISLDFKDMKFKNNEYKDAQNLLNQLNQSLISVTDIKRKDVTKRPKRLFSLATLQNYMNSKHKWSLDKTLKVTQNLYEKRYVTYPRTNTEYLADNEEDKIINLINKIRNTNSIFLNKYDFNNAHLEAKKTLFDSSKVESHSAITITNDIPVNCDNMDKDEELLYTVILNRCLANFCADKCVVNSVNVKFDYCGYDATLTGQTVIEEGYLHYENDIKDKEIPNFIIGETLKPNNKIEEKETKPKENVTEQELNKFFENPFKNELNDKENTDEDYKNILNGVEIGTPATRSSTIEKCKKIGYITSKKNSLIITEKGISFINILMKLNINLWAEKTALLSQNLKQIYKGNKTIKEVVSDAETEVKEIISSNVDISNEVKNTKEVIGYCPICGKPVYENSKAFGCSGYKDGCKFTIWKQISGKKITKSVAEQLLNNIGKPTKKMKGFISKKGSEFSAKLVLGKDGKINFIFN